MNVPEERFDLFVSLYAGFVSPACTRYLRRGGWLLANDSHGDTGLARLDPVYEFVAAVHRRAGRYRFISDDRDAYFAPKRAVVVTPELLRTTQRGVAYTNPARDNVISSW